MPLPKCCTNGTDLRKHHLLRMKPFGIARELGKLLVVKRFHFNAGKVMPYEDKPLSEVVVLPYFPVFDKFTNVPWRILMISLNWPISPNRNSESSSMSSRSPSMKQSFANVRIATAWSC